MKQTYMMALMAPAFLTACVTGAPDMETARRAEARGDYAVSVKHYEQLAEFGLPEANLEMGEHYYKGQGGKKDFKKALAYYDRAGVSEDPNIARSATRAKAELGTMALKQGGRESTSVGLDYLQRAAEAGDQRALFELGYAYETGTGVPKNGQKALEYYSQAGALGYGRADFRQAKLYEKGKMVPKNNALALQYYEAAVRKDYPRAYLNMGRIYEKGLGVPADPSKALAYYTKANQEGIDANKDLNRLRKTVGQSLG